MKLNLGCGDKPIDGYENLDRKLGDEVYPLPYPDGVASEIRASHILEHFSHTEVQAVINEWVRVLEPGGLLKIAVPDFEYVVRAMAAGHPIEAQGFIMGGHTDSDDRHGTIFDKGLLSRLFAEAGLESVSEWGSDNDDCSALPISLNLQARKPVAPAGSLEFTGVYGIVPVPRYGPSEHHKCIYDTLARYNLVVRSVSGCFWNQHWCNAAEDAVSQPDCRYLLSFDYDSVFTPEDVAQLYRIMETHPHIDALVPMQAGRGDDHLTPLFRIEDTDGHPVVEVQEAVFDRLTTPIATGHFGLTIIRAERLRDLPKPWMVGVPDIEGRWSSAKTDPDIYFWRLWSQHGRTAHLACRVVIGHIQDMVLWPGKDLVRTTQTVSDYLINGKPKEAR